MAHLPDAVPAPCNGNLQHVGVDEAGNQNQIPGLEDLVETKQQLQLYKTLIALIE